MSASQVPKQEYEKSDQNTTPNNIDNINVCEIRTVINDHRKKLEQLMQTLISVDVIITRLEKQYTSK
jgi:hypothetical protein